MSLILLHISHMSDKHPCIVFFVCCALILFVYHAIVAYFDWLSAPYCIGIDPSGLYVQVSCP